MTHQCQRFVRAAAAARDEEAFSIGSGRIVPGGEAEELPRRREARHRSRLDGDAQHPPGLRRQEEQLPPISAPPRKVALLGGDLPAPASAAEGLDEEVRNSGLVELVSNEAV